MHSVSAPQWQPKHTARVQLRNSWDSLEIHKYLLRLDPSLKARTSWSPALYFWCLDLNHDTGSHFTSHHTRLHYKIFFFFWGGHSPSGLGFYQNKLQNHFQHATLLFTSEWVGELQISHKKPRWDLCYLCPSDMASFVKTLQVEAQYDDTELRPDTTRYWWTHMSIITDLQQLSEGGKCSKWSLHIYFVLGHFAEASSAEHNQGWLCQ